MIIRIIAAVTRMESYGLAIVKPAEGRTQDVVDALNAYVESEQQSMEHYLEDERGPCLCR